MPQEIRVLQCFDCHVYQVDIVKKSPKWQCKLCGAKQSVFKEHFRGSGPDCRLHAQQLNRERALNAQRESDNLLALMNDEEELDMATIAQIEEHEKLMQLETQSRNTSSKWDAFC